MGLGQLTNGYHDNGVAQDSSLLRNDRSKTWVVQKFGGTSVGRYAEGIVEHIIK